MLVFAFGIDTYYDCGALLFLKCVDDSVASFGGIAVCARRSDTVVFVRDGRSCMHSLFPSPSPTMPPPTSFSLSIYIQTRTRLVPHLSDEAIFIVQTL